MVEIILSVLGGIGFAMFVVGFITATMMKPEDEKCTWKDCIKIAAGGCVLASRVFALWLFYRVVVALEGGV